MFKCHSTQMKLKSSHTWNVDSANGYEIRRLIHFSGVLCYGTFFVWSEMYDCVWFALLLSVNYGVGCYMFSSDSLINLHDKSNKKGYTVRSRVVYMKFEFL